MQNRSIWTIEYYDDYSGQWVNTGFFFSKEEAKEYCDLKNNSGAFHTYHYNEKGIGSVKGDTSTPCGLRKYDTPTLTSPLEAYEFNSNPRLSQP